MSDKPWNVFFNLSLNITQPIYTFGKIEAASEPARAGVQAAKGYIEQARAEATYNAMRAYWGLKWARAAIDTLDEGLGKLKDWIDKIDGDLNASPPRGGYTEADLARLKLAYDNSKLWRGDMYRALLIAQSGMRVLTNDPQADVDEEEIDFMENTPRPVSFWQDAALTHRPEAKLLQAGLAAAKGMRKWKLAEMLPDFGLSASAGYLYAPEINTPIVKAGSFNAFLALRTPIDWGIRYGRLEQAKAEERAAEARRRHALGGIAVEVDKAYADVEEARTRAETLNHGAKVARGWYNAVDQNMKSGLVSDGRELVESARSYFDFRIRYLQAIMDTNLTLAWLRRATGVE